MMAILPHVEALANVLKQAYVDPAVNVGQAIAGAGRAVYNQASTGEDVNSLGKTLYQAYLEQPVRGGKALGGGLGDALGWYLGKARSAADYSDTYDRYTKSGIAGGGPFGRRPYSTDAGRLASLSTSGSYQNDPMMQARFVALLKQLGYLPHQAY